MKKIIFILSVLLLIAPHVFAKTSPTPTPTIVQYELPFPGIVSTHPLYFLKNIRDTIIERLVRDPIKKAQFYILQGDKKLHMAMILADSNNPDEATVLFAQSLDNRQKVVALLESMGEDAPAFVIEKAAQAMEKHRVVLQSRNLDINSIQELLERVKKLLL